jgi:hypothetical protein
MDTIESKSGKQKQKELDAAEQALKEQANDPEAERSSKDGGKKKTTAKTKPSRAPAGGKTPAKRKPVMTARKTPTRAPAGGKTPAKRKPVASARKAPARKAPARRIAPRRK